MGSVENMFYYRTENDQKQSFYPAQNLALIKMNLRAKKEEI